MIVDFEEIEIFMMITTLPTKVVFGILTSVK